MYIFVSSDYNVDDFASVLLFVLVASNGGRTIYTSNIFCRRLRISLHSPRTQIAVLPSLASRLRILYMPIQIDKNPRFVMKNHVGYITGKFKRFDNLVLISYT